MTQSVKSVYLAGPISGLSYRECIRWREFAVRQYSFPNEGPVKIIANSPLRFKSYLSGEEVMEHQYPHVLSTQRGITERDFYDCRNCDLLLVNLIGAKMVSIGTVMEIDCAFQHRIPCVMAIEDSGNPHDHPMIREAVGFRTNTLEEAIEVSKMILLPGYHVDGDVVFDGVK